MREQEEQSAGILVLRWTPRGWQYLTLVTDMMSKSGRRLDFPKGHVEKDEDWIEAAVRETGEESGLPESSLNFAWGERHIDCRRTGKTCRIFLAWTDGRPAIRRNPESGIYEHIGWKWLYLEGDRDEELIHAYIRPAVGWARSIVLGR